VTNTAAVGSTGSGGGAGRPLPGDVTIKKAFDACSSALLRSVARGSVSASASVVQRDGSGNVIASLELRDVLITGWNVGGQARDSSPDESLTLAFREVCLSGSGSARVCYDVRDNRVT
jgi:type VI protein secretion system component Hcp